MALSTFASPLRRALLLSGLLAPLAFAGSARAQVTFGAGTEAAPAAAAPAPAAAAPAALAPAPAEAAPVIEEGGGGSPEWRERDHELGEASSLGGGVGLLHMQHAQGGAPGQFRMGFTTEFFSAGFLCNTATPCPALTPGGAPITNDTMNHIGATLTLDATLLKWLEVYLVTGAYANSDSSNNPGLLQVLGDTTLGMKAFGGLSKVFYVGGGPDLTLVNGSGAVGLDGGATSAKFRLIGTADLRGMESRTPLRFSINAAYAVDNTGDVVHAVEAANGGNPVSRIDRFGLAFNRVDHFDINLGAEAFLLNDRIRPFVEYGLMVPLNRQNYFCPLMNASNDGCLGDDHLAPSKLTLGSRFYPWKNGFSLLLAADIGVTGVTNFIEEVAPTPPWTMYIGAGWAVDVWDRPPVETTRIVEKAVAAPQGHAKGLVHEKDKDTPVPNAIVAFEGHPDITSLATSGEGRFRTGELSPGVYKFVVHADGYREGTCEAAIAATPDDVPVDCPLEALPRVGNLVGHVKDIANQAPVPSASLKVVAQGKELRASTDNEGAYRIDGIAPGAVTIEVQASGYLALVQGATVKIRQDNNVELSILRQPKDPLVSVTDKEIRIKQQIQFALDSSVILPESNGLLTEIADTIIKYPRISRIEVQGHTDNSGTADHNKVLSEQRANAVRDWLTAHGVGADRLVARGYGQEKPLVPNVTPAMKARNRRVQFIIIEQASAPSLDTGKK